MKHQNLQDAGKIVLRGKFIALNDYIRKEKYKINHLRYHIENQKKKASKFKRSKFKRKQVNSKEINEIRKRKSIEKINKSKSLFCGKKKMACLAQFQLSLNPSWFFNSSLKHPKYHSGIHEFPLFTPSFLSITFCFLQVKTVLPQIPRLGLWHFKYNYLNGCHLRINLIQTSVVLKPQNQLRQRETDGMVIEITSNWMMWRNLLSLSVLFHPV